MDLYLLLPFPDCNASAFVSFHTLDVIQSMLFLSLGFPAWYQPMAYHASLTLSNTSVTLCFLYWQFWSQTFSFSSMLANLHTFHIGSASFPAIYPPLNFPKPDSWFQLFHTPECKSKNIFNTKQGKFYFSYNFF